jgi:hypothetical protein
MIDILLMSRTLHMLVQSPQRRKFPVAEVAFVVLPIPSPLRCNHLDTVVARHRQHGPGDDVVAVHGLDYVVDFGAIEARGTGA